MGWQGLLERQEMESKFCQWETILLVAGCSSSGCSYCGHGCTLVLWKVSGSGGPCLYSLPEVTEILWKIEKTAGQGFALDGVAAAGLCFMGLVLGWQDCFWRLWNLPSVGSSWQMESAKGMALKTSPKSSCGVTPGFLIWRDEKYCHFNAHTRIYRVTPAASHGDGLKPLELWAIVKPLH